MSFGIPVRNGLAIGLLSSTTLSSNGGLFPAMYLDFLQPFLDSRITFSRGSNATLVDATGKIVYAPANLVTYSQDFASATWAGTSATKTSTNNADPFGGSTALLLTADGTSTTHYIGSTAGGAISYTSGTTYTTSYFVKAGTATLIQITMPGSAFGTSQYANFQLTGSGSVTASTGGTAAITPSSNGYYRISWTAAATVTTTASTGLIVFITSGADGRVPTNSSTQNVFLWGAQLEPVTYQTTPSPYVATTASAYYGPRFDYDPVTLAPKGLLIEEARANLLTYSEQFDNAVWSKINCTVTTNATTSPDGTTNAEKLIVTNALSTGNVSQIPTLAASTAYTETVFAKKGEWNWVALETRGEVGDPLLAWFNLNTGVVGTVNVGATATITNFGNGWYRCSLTRTTGATTTSSRARVYATNADAVLSTGDGTSGIFLYGAQLEAGSFATSYIPTVASTVTRNADVATMTGTNFSSWYNPVEGTFVAGFQTLQAGVMAATGYVLGFDLSASKRLIYIASGADVATSFDGTLALGSAGDVTGGISNVASAYTPSERAIASNGGVVTTGTVAAGYSTATSLNIGVGAGSISQLNGYIRSIRYYPTRLSNTQLQALTL